MSNVHICDNPPNWIWLPCQHSTPYWTVQLPTWIRHQLDEIPLRIIEIIKANDLHYRLKPRAMVTFKLDLYLDKLSSNSLPANHGHLQVRSISR